MTALRRWLFLRALRWYLGDIRRRRHGAPCKCIRCVLVAEIEWVEARSFHTRGL